MKIHDLQLAAPANDRGNDDADVVERLLPMAARLLGAADAGGADGLTPERLAKLGAFLDSIPSPAERKPAKQAPPATTAAKPNGANGAQH